ncbi:pirin family protein [Dietzia sp. SLG310A2-38A2]|nr:pirin family protein [Dietzia sp. SLG310A2-38A2]
MSNLDTRPEEIECEAGGSPGGPEPGGAAVEIITSRDVPLGGPRAMTVKRTLPQRQRSLIGAWCFVDHYGPDDVSATGGMDVPSHPHTGLQTVSWLFEGNVTHHDSGDNHAVVRPGEVNLMTSGAGICHTEVSTQDTGVLHGVQLWTVLPERHRESSGRGFEHYVPEEVEYEGGSALVFIGSLLGSSSSVTTYSPLLGAELRLDPGARLTLDVDPEFEHGLLVDAGDITLEGVTVESSQLGYTGLGETTLKIDNTGSTPARMILIGGTPFGEEIVMWWNFIGRSHDEIVRYRQEWEAGSDRFGRVDGYIGRNPDGLTRLPAPTLPGSVLTPRANPAARAQTGEGV